VAKEQKNQRLDEQKIKKFALPKGLWEEILGASVRGEEKVLRPVDVS